jgi:hypothetical protein
MTEQGIDPDDFLGEPPADDPTPDDYTSIDQSTAVSPDTGTVYAPDGEPETTPHDQELLEEDDA